MNIKEELTTLMNNCEGELKEISDMAEEIYQKNFSDFFKVPRELSEKLTKGSDISDTALEDVLITTPLKLFEGSEALNKFRLSLEVLKTRVKSNKSEISKRYVEEHKISGEKYTQAQLTQYVEEETFGDNLLVTLYDSVIKRVENEMSFTKELIMSAKKLYSARVENVMPIGEVDIDSPKKNDRKPEKNDSLLDFQY